MKGYTQGTFWAVLIGLMLMLSGCSNLEDAEGLYRQGNNDKAFDVAAGFLSDGDPKVRAQAATLVGKIGGERAAKALLPLLKDEEESVVIAGIKGIGKAGYAPIGETLTHQVPVVHGAVFDALAKAFGQLGTQAIDPLVAALDSGASDADTAGYRAMLVQIGSPVAKSIAGSFKGKTAEENQVKLAILVEIRSPAVPRLLIELIDDPEVAQMVVRSLVQLGSMSVDPAVSKLTKLKGSDGDSIVKELLCRALGDIKSRRAVPILEAMAKDNSDLVRAAADGALVKVRGF